MNKDTYLTLVFKADRLSEEERSTLVERCSAASWSHAIDERKALEAEVERLQHLLLEKFKEWQIDSGEWDEVEWLERVQVALFGKEQPEEQAKEVQP